MDRAESTTLQAEPQGPVDAAHSNYGNTPSSQANQTTNRLLYQIRSMPLVSLLLGRNISSRNVINDSNSFFLLKCIMGFHLLILIILVGLSTFTIYYYNIRFYKTQTRPSETLIVCWLLRGIWRTLNSTWSLRYYCVGVETTPNLKLSNTFYNLASILWIGLAVIFLGVSPKEDLKSVSSRICYFLLWTTIASYVVPMLAYTFMCFLLYLTLFVVIYFRHGSIPLSSSAMPLTLLKKLRVQRYREVLKTLRMLEEADKSDVKSSFDVKKLLNVGEKTPITMRESLSDCVNNSEMLAERICSICILKISDDDKVFLLPCDLRHLFHRDCLKKWFKRSSDCPICRSNIADILTEKDNPPKEKGIFDQDPRYQENVMDLTNSNDREVDYYLDLNLIQGYQQEVEDQVDEEEDEEEIIDVVIVQNTEEPNDTVQEERVVEVP